MSCSAAYERFICDSLAGKSPAWGRDWPGPDFVSSCEVHGVTALLHDCLSPSQAVPGPVLEALRQVSDRQTLFNKLHTRELGRLVADIDQCGIRHIILKGAAIAHSHYQDSFLRSRGDIDILIQDRDADRLTHMLEKAGYELAYESTGVWQTQQRSFRRVDEFQCEHILDVHTAISNRSVFASHLQWDELYANTRMQGMGDGKTFRALNDTYALLHAALHRASHIHAPYYADGIQHRGDRLIWLYDIYLLSRGLAECDWDNLGVLARNKKMQKVLTAALAASTARFPSPGTEDRLELLDIRQPELSALLLRPQRYWQTLTDILGADGLANQGRLLFQLLLPSPAFMQRKYKPRTAWALAWLYPKRLVQGLGRQFD